MRSPLYWSGHLYGAGIWLTHGRTLKKRYEYIGSLCGDSVLDVGCGTGKLTQHIPKDADYLGLDLNEKFLDFAKKRGRNVMKQDALTFDRYGDYDVCVIMDVLHHINPHHERFMKKVLNDVRKRVIVCEPFDMPNTRPVMKKLILMIDADGCNKPEEWMDKDSLVKFYSSFGPTGIKEIGNALIAVYDKT